MEKGFELEGGGRGNWHVDSYGWWGVAERGPASIATTSSWWKEQNIFGQKKARDLRLLVFSR